LNVCQTLSAINTHNGNKKKKKKKRRQKRGFFFTENFSARRHQQRGVRVGVGVTKVHKKGCSNPIESEGGSCAAVPVTRLVGHLTAVGLGVE
jgi:hypothetical protein